MNPQQPTSEPSEDRQDFHPGQTISPRDQSPAPAPVQSQPAPSLPAPVAEPTPSPAPAKAVEEPERNLYNPDPGGDSEPQPAEQAYQAPQDIGQVVSWTASEFISHEKSQIWYLKLGGVAIVVTALVYLISRDIISAIVVVIAAALFGAMASRQPRQMQYEVDFHGLSIGNKHHPYGNFRSFSVSEEGPLRSINFMPLKRFAPPLAIYFAPEDEARITEVLASHLPLETHKHDAVDKLMRRVRF
jgi:hypothetical protein